MAAAAAPVSFLKAAPGGMSLCMHQQTSSGAGYRASLEGWARAGIRYVEFTAPLVDAFVKQDGMPAARSLLSDLKLTPVSGGSVQGLWEPNPNRAAAIENLKRTGEMYNALGVDRMVCPSRGTTKFTADDYKRGIDNIREAGEIAKQIPITLMIEFTMGSTFIGTLPTSLRLTREAAHPNVKPMLDCFHFETGLSKFEDLDLIQPGEIHHMHFQDVPDIPREMVTFTDREIPGEGVSPLAAILRKAAARGYSGPVSVELFYPKYQKTDPYEMARHVREKAEPVMRAAGVLA